ncbi:hypothetical protein [Sphaerisporangium sp. NPDC051011]|uniref:hypothetical protein n=1 Tax=Sphaerisporangium sp. NPDC051011 TaxID=3155792 RepID=UPI00340F91E4
MPLTTRTVTATYQRADSTPAAGEVLFRPNVALASPADDVLVAPIGVRAVLDAGGALSVTLACTDNAAITPAGWAYVVTEKITGAPTRTYLVNVPSGVGAVNLADLAPLQQTPTPVVQYVQTAGGVMTGPLILADGSSAISAAHPIFGMGTVHSHSYGAGAGGAFDQTGRFDAIVRLALGIDHTGWRARGVIGAQLVREGRAHGGFGRIFQEILRSTTRPGPYTGDGGGLIMCYGINDLGVLGATLGMAQVRAAFVQVMRACISLWRASKVFDDTSPTIAYGSGFTQVSNTSEWSYGTTTRDATALANANFTITLPNDYAGEPIAICLNGATGATGGTVTWSGTAGVSGSVSTSNILPAGAATHTKIVQRITSLTAANAGQTIVGTVTQLDAGGTVSLDAWWLESKTPPPVIVCDIPRLTAAGYAQYAGWLGTEAAKDADIVATNDAIKTLVAEFDGMVQIAGLDSALSKQANLYLDGLHPNEWGASKCADQVLAAIRRLVPTTFIGGPASINVPAPRGGSMVRPHLHAAWYTAEARAEGPVYPPVVGDMFLLPIMVTGGRERATRIGLSVFDAGTVSPAIRWGLYDDVGQTGQPGALIAEATSASGPFTVPLAAGLAMCPASGPGSFFRYLDPGLYWMALKVVTPGTGQTWRTIAGTSPALPNVRASDGALAVGTGFKLGSQGTGALPGAAPTVAAPLVADAVPMMCVQMLVR